MPMSLESDASVKALIARAADDLVMDVDGFVYYWPNGQGQLSAWMLRALADELDRRNAAWESEIEQYFEAQDAQERRDTGDTDW